MKSTLQENDKEYGAVRANSFAQVFDQMARDETGRWSTGFSPVGEMPAYSLVKDFLCALCALCGEKRNIATEGSEIEDEDPRISTDEMVFFFASFVQVRGQ